MKKLVVITICLVAGCAMTPEQRQRMAAAMGNASQPQTVQCQKIGDMHGQIMTYPRMCPAGTAPVR